MVRKHAWFHYLCYKLLFTKVLRACRCFNISLLTSYVYKMIEGRGLWTPHVYVLYLYSRISWTESKIGCCYYISDWLLCCSSQWDQRFYEVTLNFSNCILFFGILRLQIIRMKSRVFLKGEWEQTLEKIGNVNLFTYILFSVTHSL